MTSESQYPNQKKVFTRYRKHLVVILIFVGLVGVFAGEEKEPSTSLCAYSNEGCKQDFGPEIVSRAIRFFGFGISAALVSAVVLALIARGYFKERVIKVKKVLLAKLSSAKSISKSANISLLNRFRKQGDKGPKMLQRQANQYATATSALAGFLFVLMIIGSVIIALSPEEQCETVYYSEYCEKDWFSSILMAIVGFFLSSLIMLSVLTVATYIQWRTSRPETDSN